MKIFLSSTCYDLKDLRAEVENFLLAKGHQLLLSDRANFPHFIGTHRHDICIENVETCDLFILVIDSRYGAPYYKDQNISITWAEFREAIRSKRKIIAFVRQEVYNERQSCRRNQKKGNTFEPAFADNIKTFDLIDEVQRYEDGVWMQPFDNSVQVKEKLESIYETKHSLLNEEYTTVEVSSNEIPLTALSGSTATFLTKNTALGNVKTINAEIIQSAIDKIPASTQPWGEVLPSEPILNYSNDFYYFFPLRPSGDEGEMVMGISPTALGRSIRSELLDLLKKIEDEDKAVAFFTDTVKRKPILCKSLKFDNKSYIIGFYEKISQLHGKVQHMCVLSLFANKWQIYHDQQLDDFMCYVDLSDEFQVITHNKKLYFYFERLIQHMGTAFNGFGVVEFSVFDFSKKSIIRLFYEGRYREEKIEGIFDFSSLEQNQDSKIYEFILEQGAARSKHIYRTPRNYNLETPENCIEKWNIDNPDFYSNEYGEIAFSYYSENLLWNFDKDDSIESYKASTEHVENDIYILFYYFAGPILGFRKSDQTYFVVLVPQGYGAGGVWGLRSINTVKFLDSEKIFAKNEYESYEINLETGQYERKALEAQ